MDRMDRRGFLECAAWTGAAVVWTASGGVLSSRLAARADAAEGEAGTFSFVQISDTHGGVKDKGEGMGALGDEQLQWLAKDVAELGGSTPIVVFGHVPLWAVYPQWGWTTEDGERALASLRRFGSVTVLNGHIHQVLQKVKGTVSFHTAMSTAFPQPAPGSAPAPGPMKIPEAEARRMIGVTEVNYVPGKHPLAVVDPTLG